MIKGDSDNDQMSGGKDNDILTGDVDKDHFNCDAGIDTITDFQLGVHTKTANCENS
jgi:Ca2+-binding RTX toxin-like protein